MNKVRNHVMPCTKCGRTLHDADAEFCVACGGLLARDAESQTVSNSQAVDIPRLKATENPWGVDVLDVRPVTLAMLSTSRDPICARNAISFAGDDGTGFIGQEPAVADRFTTALRYRIDGFLADGAFFIPSQMEHKWAIYFHQDTVIFVRSWLRQVQAIARVRVLAGYVEIYELHGRLISGSKDPLDNVRALDFLIRTHALNTTYPAPLPSGMDADGYAAALWCMSLFGNRALFATTQAPRAAMPDEPLRTHSLLHIAVARGDIDAVDRHLGTGMPIDLLAADGLAPLHWALASATPTVLEHLLAKGALVDVRSVEGATPLMNAVQARSLEKCRALIARGADVNATDRRGFTALHRAAEMGQANLVTLLLQSGAEPGPIAEGTTPLSLAEQRNEPEIMELLAQRKPTAVPRRHNGVEPEDADDATAVHVVERVLTELQHHDGDTGKYASSLAREIVGAHPDRTLVGCTDGDLLRLVATRRMRSVDAALHYGLNRLDPKKPWPEEGMSCMVLGRLLSERDRVADAATQRRSSNKIGCPHDTVPLVAGSTAWLCDACGSAVCPRCRALFAAHWPLDAELPWWSLNCECMGAVVSEFDLRPPDMWTKEKDILDSPPPVKAPVVAPGDPLARWIPDANSVYDGSVRAILLKSPGVTGASMSWAARWDRFVETLVASEMNAKDICFMLEALDRLYLYCIDRGYSGWSSDEITLGRASPLGIPEALRKICIAMRHDIETHWSEFAELQRRQSREWKRFWDNVNWVRPSTPTPKR